jgi:hypothetical protein
MRIAVYGDSFACGDISTKHFQWLMLLGEKLNASVTSFGLGGTPLYYSYKLFQKNYKNFDLNIFCVTGSGRYHKGISFGGTPEWPNSIDTIESIKQRYTNLPKHDIELLDNIKSWYLSSNDEYMIDVQEVFLQSIEKECEQVVLLPTSHTSMNEERKKKHNIGKNGCMVNFWSAQCKYWGLSKIDSGFRENVSRMACHFTPETNKVVADSVYNYIFKNEVFDSPEIINQNNDVDYYYVSGDY